MVRHDRVVLWCCDCWSRSVSRVLLMKVCFLPVAGTLDRCAWSNELGVYTRSAEAAKVVGASVPSSSATFGSNEELP